MNFRQGYAAEVNKRLIESNAWTVGEDEPKMNGRGTLDIDEAGETNTECARLFGNFEQRAEGIPILTDTTLRIVQGKLHNPRLIGP